MMSLQDQIMEGGISTTNNAESWIDICKGFCAMLDIEMIYPADLSYVVLAPHADSILPSPVRFDTNISVLVIEFLRKLLHKKVGCKQAMVPVFQTTDGERLYQVFSLDRSTQKQVIALRYDGHTFWLDYLNTAHSGSSLLQLIRGTTVYFNDTAYPTDLSNLLDLELVKGAAAPGRNF